LRKAYLEERDDRIYDILISYFNSVSELLWSNRSEKSYVVKTVGIQASFDFLRILIQKFPDRRDINEEFFWGYMTRVAKIDYADEFFQASGKGRTRIKNAMAMIAGLFNMEQLPSGDRDGYKRLSETAN